MITCYVVVWPVRPDRRRSPLWTALRGAGLRIMASWIDSGINTGNQEPTAERWSRHWQICLEQSAAADITLFFAPEGATQCGFLIEIGSALQARPWARA